MLFFSVSQRFCGFYDDIRVPYNLNYILQSIFVLISSFVVDSDTYSLLKGYIYIYISQDTEHLKAEVPNYDFCKQNSYKFSSYWVWKLG